MMLDKVKTNYEKESVVPVPYKRKVRLLLWGGAATPGDNSAGPLAMSSKLTKQATSPAPLSSTRSGWPKTLSSITADFSTQLAKAGKSASVVIGHADQANPNINGGGEKNSEQDYRHGQRVIFSKGKIIQVTKQKHHLAERDLEALAKKSQP